MKNDKGYDIVTVIGVAASIVAFVLILVFRPGMPKTSAQGASGNENGELVSGSPESSVAPGAQENGGTLAMTEGGSVSAGLIADVRIPRPPSGTPASVLTTGGTVHVSVDGAGGGVTGIRLDSYLLDVPRKGAEEPGPVVLGDSGYPFLALTPTASCYALEKPSFESAGDGKSVSVERISADGRLKVIETWAVDDARPGEIKYGVDFVNLSEADMMVEGFRLEGSAMPASVTPSRKAGRGESSGGFSFSGSGKVNDYSIKNLNKLDDAKREQLAATPVEWAAVHSKYFVMAFWMDGGQFPGVECAAVPSTDGGDGPSRYHMRTLLPTFALHKGESRSISVTAYAGPKMFERLYAYGNGLVSVMEMDRFFFWRPAWMRAISRCLLNMLVWISERFPKNIGYGLAVIILTVIVKVIFWPLSHKSTASMRKMQALKPQLDELRAKYKDDPQTMYRKQQELFKKNHVSQIGGCLPMLLQIPVFFALFNTFRNAIEMRHASFLWAYDLSMPDTLPFSPEAVPIRPLALLMGLTMYFQQRLTPNPDPQQAKMMNFMTIFFIFLFYGMPSALTLYLSVSYLLGIAQTMITNRLLPPVVLQETQPAGRR